MIKDYQHAGIKFLEARSRAFLADDAGLGKSLQLIKAANNLGARRVIIITPAIGRGSWKLQLAEWDNLRRPVVLFPNRHKTIPAGPCALIVTCEWLSRKGAAELLTRLLHDPKAEPFDVGIVDEAQTLKNPTAVRTKAVYGRGTNLANSVFQNLKHRWLASATFTPLNVSELYPHLRALFPDLLAGLFRGHVPTLTQFEDRFCWVYESRFGREIMGNNQETILELREAIRPYIMLRRKADVLDELPPILTLPLPLETNFDADTYTLGMTEAALDALTDDQVLALVQQLETAPTAQSPRQALGMAKAEGVATWVRTFLDDNPGKKILVFAHHRTVIEYLRDQLTPYGLALIYGGVSPAQKDTEVDRFQNDPGVRVFVGQNHAAGTAITLTAAHTVVLVEPDPSPDQNYQIISRAHRIGQAEPVSAYVAYDAAVPLERRRVGILRRRAADNYHLFGSHVPGVLNPNVQTQP